MAARPLATIDGSAASSLAIGGGPEDTQLEPVTPCPPLPISPGHPPLPQADPCVLT